MTFKISKTQLSTKVVVFVALTGLLPIAHANILTPGTGVPPSQMSPSGTVVASIINGTITPTAPDFTATYSTWVYQDPFNFFCANCLDFVYQFTNNGPAVNERYSMSNFDGSKVNVGVPDLSKHSPIIVNRTLSGGGSIIAFNYTVPTGMGGIPVASGETTQLLVIETNATHWAPGILSVQNGSAASNAGFQPAIPEPSSLALIGTGIVAVGGFLRRSGLGKNR